MAAIHKDKTFFTAEDAEENPRLSKYSVFIKFQLPGFWICPETSTPYIIFNPFVLSLACPELRRMGEG